MPVRGFASWVAALSACVLAGAASAAPLCRDGKGLFTPCPRAANHRARAILASAAPSAVSSKPKPLFALPRDEAGAVRRTRLCIDTKGLFTPCPR